MPLFRRTKRWLILTTGLLLSSVLLAACGGTSPSILDTAGPVADQEKFVFWVILIIATLVFVGVEGALIYSVVRFRERPGTPEPRQIHGSLKIEIIWTVIPALILFVVLIYTVQGLFIVAAQPADSKTVEVKAIGHQWWWEFYYPQSKITTADQLVVPVGTVIQVDLYSNNVIHSFWVPALTGKTDLVPGHNNQKWFKADKVGTYTGICAEFCGTQHANMRFRVDVKPYDEYLTWVSTQQQAAIKPTSGLAATGAQLFAAQCSSCHGIVGVNNVASYQDTTAACNDPKKTNNCLIGPNLTHFGSRDLIAGGVLEYSAKDCQPGSDLLQRCNLAKWLHDPQGIKPGNDMAIGQLSDDQISALVAYLLTLK